MKWNDSLSIFYLTKHFLDMFETRNMNESAKLDLCSYERDIKEFKIKTEAPTISNVKIFKLTPKQTTNVYVTITTLTNQVFQFSLACVLNLIFYVFVFYYAFSQLHFWISIFGLLYKKPDYSCQSILFILYYLYY